ncbi:hypothetical protein DPMN_020233 [Dreissena polymorpha]|uniref:Uncharacterized protein n=1 Tax=Dreissena polymorpha TaxID=45954 RepID=A0A9D4NIG2_DREPO|nr:hypothetical protein DPMN_020233 [Dreissena polymorpha]
MTSFDVSEMKRSLIDPEDMSSSDDSEMKRSLIDPEDMTSSEDEYEPPCKKMKFN